MDNKYVIQYCTKPIPNDNSVSLYVDIDIPYDCSVTETFSYLQHYPIKAKKPTILILIEMVKILHRMSLPWIGI